MAATRVAGTMGRAKTAAPISIWVGVFIVSTDRNWFGLLLLRNLSEEGEGNRTGEHGPADHQTWGADEPEEIGKCACSFELDLNRSGGHVNQEPLDIQIKGFRHTPHRGLFGNHRCPHEAAAKLLLLALTCGGNRCPGGQFRRRPEDWKFVLHEPVRSRIFGQQGLKIPLECTAEGATKLTELGDRNHSIRGVISEQGWAWVSAQGLHARPACSRIR